MILHWTDGLPRNKTFEFRKWLVVLANGTGNEWRTRDECGWVGEGIVGVVFNMSLAVGAAFRWWKGNCDAGSS